MVLLLARHPVQDVAKFKEGYNGAEAKAVRDRHGVKNDAVYNTPEDANDVLVIHYFDSAEQAGAFLADPGLGEAMQALGVAGEPHIPDVPRCITNL